MNILIIDDDTGITGLLQSICDRSDHHADVINDSTEILAGLKQDYDLILLDLDMPKMDGIEVMRVLSSRKVESPLVLMSGFDQAVLNTAHDLAEAHNLNVITHMSKPFKVKDVQRIFDLAESYTSKSEAVASVQELTAKELRAAISENRIQVYYQPQMDLKSQRIIGMEALCRLIDSKGKIVFPDAFIPTAEKLDMIHELTMEIVRIVATDSEEIFSEYNDLTISVNVSTQDLEYLTFPEDLAKVFKSHGVDINRIVVEVTETLLVHDLHKGLDVLARLRLKGFKVSIDDFGKGASTLEHIKHFPATELKIDKEFIQSLGHQDKSHVLVKHTVELAHQLKLDIVAEGVEDLDTLAWLKEVGCDIAQGYWLSKPLCKTDMLAFLQKELHTVKSDSVFSNDSDEFSKQELTSKKAEEAFEAPSSLQIGSDGSKRVVFSAILPKTGTFSFIGQSQLYGIKAALQLYDEAKKDKDISVTMELFDDQSDMQRYYDITRGKLSSESLACIGGVFTLGNTKWFIKSSIAARRPVVGAFTGTILLRNKDWQNIYNVRPSYEDELDCILEKIRNYPDKVVLAYPDNGFGERALSVLEKKIDLQKISYGSDTRSHAFLIDKLKASSAKKVIFIGAAKTLSEILSVLDLPDTHFYTISLVGLGSLVNSMSECKKPVSVTVPIENYQGNSAGAKDFRRSISKVVDEGCEKFINSISFESFINMQVLLTALKSTDDYTRDGIALALERLQGEDIGLEAPVSWDPEKRQFLHQVKLLDNKNGTLV